MMRNLAAATFLLGALGMLSGCQPAPQIYLINNTGTTIQVIQSAAHWRDYTGKVNIQTWNRIWSWPFLIDNGVGRRIDNAPAQEWILDVRVARCRLHFEAAFGRDFHGEQWRSFERLPITAQIEADGRLYRVAVSPADRPVAVDITRFIAIQPEGFPVEPSSRVCRRR